MKKIISMSEVLAVPHKGLTDAQADATYDEDKGELTVVLKAIPVGRNELSSETGFSEKRPVSQSVKIKVSIEEVIPAAKDIFHNWTRKLQQSRFALGQ